MRVKFFSSEPQKLRDEYTRYLYVLQLRKQLEKGTLQCTDDQVAAELAAFLLQGDYFSLCLRHPIRIKIDLTFLSIER